MPKWGGGKTCGRCGKSVYKQEEAIAAGQSWHKLGCFTCQTCNKSLDSTTVSDNVDSDGKVSIFCKACYGKKHGPKGYGYGAGAGALTNTGKWNEQISYFFMGTVLETDDEPDHTCIIHRSTFQFLVFAPCYFSNNPPRSLLNNQIIYSKNSELLDYRK